MKQTQEDEAAILTTHGELRERIESENPAKYFWSGLGYIIDTFERAGEEDEQKTGYGVDCQSITLSMEEWKAIHANYSKLEEVILDVWENASKLADDLEEMKWLHPDDAEAFRKADQVIAENILVRLEDFVDNDKVEV